MDIQKEKQELEKELEDVTNEKEKIKATLTASFQDLLKKNRLLDAELKDARRTYKHPTPNIIATQTSATIQSLHRTIDRQHEVLRDRQEELDGLKEQVLRQDATARDLDSSQLQTIVVRYKSLRQSFARQEILLQSVQEENRQFPVLVQQLGSTTDEYNRERRLRLDAQSDIDTVCSKLIAMTKKHDQFSDEYNRERSLRLDTQSDLDNAHAKLTTMTKKHIRPLNNRTNETSTS
ncbi:hypothetical protein C8J56DRAFT_14479 [Mycena floridula]|nr:hypothetical protein C8J56DRAFT_14479 [Mycena floridula]